MLNLILFDDDSRERFLPLTYTRPLGGLRLGILTIQEKWATWLNGKTSYITQEYLSTKFPIHIEADNYIINSSFLPNEQLCSIILSLQPSEAILHQGELVATRLNEKQIKLLMRDEEIEELRGYELVDIAFTKLMHLTDVFTYNAQEIENDFTLLTQGRLSASLTESNWVMGEDQIFVEEGASVECCTLNAKHGPIYIGKEVEIMEGSVLRGPIALCEGSIVKMGAKIYGGSTFGPYCRVGGEIKNVVFQGYSNKGHDGYLGNAVIGNWCNIGAGTSASNLKNNYSTVKQWSYLAKDYVSTQLQFCGLVMGDYSRCAINSSFNTGSVVGINANVFGDGLLPKFIPSFSWGGEARATYALEKAIDLIERIYERRDQQLEAEDRLILIHLFEQTARYRTWEPTTI
jgi:UDP-N-acetylglucosamine diphosphorylase/glucosamine-1-phosphate N-acetyltransferase